MVQLFEGTIDKSENDRDRSYEPSLANKLDVMLVSEPEDKAAACVMLCWRMQNRTIYWGWLIF